MKVLVDFGNKVQTGFEPAPLRLIEIRALQINGCALGLRHHTRDARECRCARGLAALAGAISPPHRSRVRS